jgi:spore germination cell wall hydrolase CwlJ-like protein
MLTVSRSALLISAALTAMTFAPAKAGPAAEPLISTASATLPKLTVPELLDPQGEPQLSEPAAPGLNSGGDGQLPAVENSTVAAPAPVQVSGDLSSMVAQLRGSDPGSRELECLAIGIYFESKSEPLAGQLAVGKVIANRAQSGGRFPSIYCGVLFQRGQFSFVRGHSLPSVPRSSKMWQTAVAVAKIVDQRLKDSAVGSAMFFHARYVSPGWRLKRVASIGNHIFYR